jgi:hypothetical protein
MNYELVKKLKDAGFPFDFKESKMGDDTYTFPSFSELVKACGESFQMLTVRSPSVNRFFQAYSQENDTAEGKTPEEAIANLWLRLNKIN